LFCEKKREKFFEKIFLKIFRRNKMKKTKRNLRTLYAAFIVFWWLKNFFCLKL